MEKEDNPGPVTQAECAARMSETSTRFETLEKAIGRIDTALWGGEGRSGMVKDMNDLLQRSRWTGATASIIVGILASVFTAWLIRMAMGV